MTATATDRVLAVCTLRPGPHPATPGTCAWCGGNLPQRARRWCSPTCRDTFTREHNWTWARAAALDAAGHRCARCGTGVDGPADVAAWARFLAATCPRPPAPRLRDIGDHAAHQAALSSWRLELRPHDEAARILAAVRRRHALEVNHRTPILGRHGEFGCHHHSDGLEVLCHPCHVAETARQFGHRTARPTDPTLFDKEAG